MHNILRAKETELTQQGLTYLKVKVIPKSSTNEIIEIMDDETIKIRITAAAEKGKANKELCKFIKKLFTATVRDVSIIGGKNERSKLIKVTHA